MVDAISCRSSIGQQLRSHPGRVEVIKAPVIDRHTIHGGRGLDAYEVALHLQSPMRLKIANSRRSLLHIYAAGLRFRPTCEGEPHSTFLGRPVILFQTPNNDLRLALLLLVSAQQRRIGKVLEGEVWRLELLHPGWSDA